LNRRRWIAGILGLVVAGGALAGWRLSSDGKDEAARRPSSGAFPAPGSPPVAAAGAFRVVYRIEDSAGPEIRTLTGVVAMRRPYEARLESRDGPPPGGKVLSATVTNRNYQFALSGDDQEDYGFAVSPATAPQTYSGPALRAGVAAGVAAEAGEDEVLGERCVRFVYLQGGTEPLAPGTETQRVESCVTADGILLREAVTLGGRRVRLAEAVTVERSPAFPAETFFTGRKPARGDPFSAQQIVAEGKAPKDVKLLLSAVPPGFSLDRRVTVRRAAGPESPPRLFYNEAFVRGPELVVTEQFLQQGVGPPWPAEEGSPQDLGEGRTGRLVVHAGSVEVRMNVDGTHARVFAPRLDLALYCARTMAAGQS
jgi:hypothetical protein